MEEVGIHGVLCDTKKQSRVCLLSLEFLGLDFCDFFILMTFLSHWRKTCQALVTNIYEADTRTLVCLVSESSVVQEADGGSVDSRSFMRYQKTLRDRALDTLLVSVSSIILDFFLQ